MMTDRDLTSAEVEALLYEATAGKRVQFHPTYCSEAKGSPFSEWDTSHEMSVIRPDGSRYKLAHYRHASDAAISQAAPTIARQLLRCMDERDTFERQLKGVLDREAETYVRLENKIEAAEAENARLREVADYILDGMAINAPEYEIDPDDDFLDGANSEWVCDVLTRLSNAMKPAPTVTAGWPTDEGDGSIIVGNVKGDNHDRP
jgi:hypothetical protein